MKKDYVKRFIKVILSLAVYSLGNAFCVLAGDAGCNAWNTLTIGMSEFFGVRFGIANVCISAVIIILDIILKGKIGFGTILNTLLIPIYSDIFIALLAFVPESPNMFVGALYAFIGQLFIGLAMVLYMRPGLGAGPRDTLMVVIGKRLKKLSIGTVKFIIEMCVLVVGFLIGGSIGLGTVVAIASQSFIFDIMCRLFKYDSRSQQNEDIFDTVRNLKNA